MNDGGQTAECPAGVFVYGTLMRGQCRQHAWPRPPQRVDKGWVRATLYAGADYPAIVAGNDRVAGEAWSYRAEDMPEILSQLDAIEGTDQPGEPNLYDRVVVDVYDDCDQPLGRFCTYHYAKPPQDDGFRRVSATPDGFARWAG